jgi:hypothetical protein
MKPLANSWNRTSTLVYEGGSYRSTSLTPLQTAAHWLRGRSGSLLLRIGLHQLLLSGFSRALRKTLDTTGACTAIAWWRRISVPPEPERSRRSIQLLNGRRKKWVAATGIEAGFRCLQINQKKAALRAIRKSRTGRRGIRLLIEGLCWLANLARRLQEWDCFSCLLRQNDIAGAWGPEYPGTGAPFFLWRKTKCACGSAGGTNDQFQQRFIGPAEAAGAHPPRERSRPFGGHRHVK